MRPEDVLAKIKKCLALSRSANEHEAAAALRQAQKLMQMHGLSEDLVSQAEVQEARTSARSPTINAWQANLAQVIDEAFGCRHFSVTYFLYEGGRKGFRDVVFVGLGGAPEIAGYAYQVLQRQCAIARQRHVASQPKNCKPITKTARGDRFAQGWVVGVRQLIEAFAGKPGDELLLDAYMKRKHPDLMVVRPKDRAVGRNVRSSDLAAGFHAGKKAQLARAVGNPASGALLGHDSSKVPS